MRLPFRKPIVVVAPKKLLKYKAASSNLDDFGSDKRFLHLIEDSANLNPAAVKKVILCSG